MQLRRLLLLQGHDNPTDLPEDDPEATWDILSEVDRLRSTNSGLTAEVQRQNQIGQDYARVASEQRLRVEELEREAAIAHTNAQMLDRRLSQSEERTAELEELVEALRSQRDRLQTYCEQQKERADRAESDCAAMREAAGDLLSASDRQTHGVVGTRGLARAKVEYADSASKLRRSLERGAGKRFLAPDVADDVRRYFTGDLPAEEKKRLQETILSALPPQR